MHTTHTQSFAELLQSAVAEPGRLSAARQGRVPASVDCRIGRNLDERLRTGGTIGGCI